MADFEVRVVAGIELRRWVDPPGSSGQPSRVRPHPGLEQLYRRAKLGQVVQLRAVVGGVEAPLDSTLGGRLFAPFLTEGFGPPFFSCPPGQTSIVLWTPKNPGHHVVGIRRHQGGAVLIHFDVAA
jgi:hypothetical protein